MTLTGRNKVTKRGSDYDRAVENGYLGDASDWLNTTKNGVVSVYTVQKNFVRNLRNTTYQSLDLVIDVHDITGTLVITHDAHITSGGLVLSDARFVDSLGVTSQSITLNVSADMHDTSYHFDVLYNQENTHCETITISASIGDFHSEEKIAMVDETDTYRYFGRLPAEPSSDTYLNGDSFVLDDPTSEYDNRIYAYNGSTGEWELLSTTGFTDAIQSAIASSSMHDVLSSIRDGGRETLLKSEYAYVFHIIVSIITADFIGAKKIHIQVDEQGNEGYIYGYHPTEGSVTFTDGQGHPIPVGYRASGKAFVIDSNGIAELSEGYARNLHVFDTLDLQNAQIIHPAISTHEEENGDNTGITFGVAGNNPVNYWYTNDLLDNMTANIYTHVLPVSGGYVRYRGESLVNSAGSANFVKVDSLDTVKYDAQSFSLPFTGNGSESHFGGIGNILAYYPTDAKISIKVSGTRKIGGIYAIYMSSLRIYASDSTGNSEILKDLPEQILANPNLASFTYNFDINPNYYQIHIDMNCTHGKSFNGSATVSVGARTMRDLGWPTTGLFLYTGDEGYRHLLDKDAYIPSTDAWEMSAVQSGSDIQPFNSSQNLKYCNPTNLLDYTSYTYEDPDTHQQVTKTLSENLTYKVNGQVNINGSASPTNILYFTRLPNNRIRVMLEGQATPVIVEQNTYLYWSDGWMKIADIEGGIELMGQYPKADNIYDLGTPEKRWLTGYISNLPLTSKRSEKKDITPFERSAIDVLKDVDIVRFKFKNDKRNTPLIGFIADDTDPDLSGVNRDSMMVNSCIGILIKAVQELSAKIDSLEQRLSQLN